MKNNNKLKITKADINFVLQEGENYLIEFKENVDKSLSKEITAFANASGGKIFVGIDDNNKVCGVEITNKLKSQIQDVAKNIEPSVLVELLSFENILIINVPNGDNKPYHCSDGFFVRMGSNSQKMKREQIIDFLQQEGRVKFDEQIHKNFQFSKHFDTTKLNRFLRIAGLTKEFNDQIVLENLGVLKDGKMVNAGVLFFSKSINLLCEQAIITCAVFDGIERIKIINRKDFDDDIITNIDNALHFVKQAIKVEYVMTGEAQRKEIYEFPLEAIREAIVNAVAHRDYFFYGAHTTIDVFDDRIEIGNPGGLPKGLNKENFGKLAVRRNQLIASLLHRVNFVENMGTGINKITTLLKENGNFDPIFEFDSFYNLTLKRNRKLNDGLNDGLNERQRKVLNYIKQYQGIKAKQISDKLNIPIATIDRYIKIFVEKNIIERRGSKKTGGYFVRG